MLCFTIAVLLTFTALEHHIRFASLVQMMMQAAGTELSTFGSVEGLPRSTCRPCMIYFRQVPGKSAVPQFPTRGLKQET